jgi:DNA invertase Pin-like site-specific DNA recombinase
MSSDRQETSIRDQRAAVERFAMRNSYELISTYADEGISGDETERRLQFQKMVSDAALRRFKAILVWDLSRLGRFDIIEAGYWMKPFRDAGVSIVTLDQGEIDWNDVAGRIVWTVQQEGKHQYLRDHARNTMRGRLESAKRGERMVQAPYGYRLSRKKLVPAGPLKARVVRRIFRETLSGASLRFIARQLNSDGIKSPLGGTWIGSTIKGMLVNRAYVGDSMWNLRYMGKYCRIVGTITDAGLAHLEGLVNLQRLHLSGTQITDAGLVSLKGLTKLEDLALEETQISDGGLVYLKELTALKSLSLMYTKTTDAGVGDLERALPGLMVEK